MKTVRGSIFLGMVFVMFTSSAGADVFPFKDGRYVTDPSLCLLSEEQAVSAYGDLLGAKVRVFKGNTISDLYELDCSVSRVSHKNKEIRFKARCEAEGETEVIEGRYGYISSTAFSFRGKVFNKCTSETPRAEPSQAYNGQCQWTKGIWESKPWGDPSPIVVHRFEFTERSVTSGPIKISELRNGIVAWTSEGEFACSNGASICYLLVRDKAGGLIKTAFEDVESSNSEHYRVFPALRQISYNHGGLLVKWRNNFSPENDERPLPSNVYLLTGCK
ncbi:hypothetical protein [Breoghania sp.]|uniref:hypothetical protein n=1 Tax=Breoghania sp. TaxID=2065378 RepID=UPI002AA64A6E|nr:hypothetical protein [Breoghania sp.]